MPAALRDRVKALAAEAGFDFCGITRPRVAARDAAALRAWVDAGHHADMWWMAEEERLARRMRPASLLDGVRSVICVAMRYTPPQPATTDGQPRGIVAAYAWGSDYHKVMKRRLRRLARALDRLLGRHDQRIFVDTAPVLEHALAASAGIAWQGKHSLSLNRTGGSWLLLGELFTTAELPCDPPATHHCGSCRACIDACPTGAIVAPFVVDARRCIAWLTIEYDGPIPPPLRPLLGRRIFGCDDCQTVCPWNRAVAAPHPDLLAPKNENRAPLLTELLTLDEAGFRIRFRGTPLRRGGRIRLVRNACIAAGNSGDRRLIPPLRALLRDEAPLLREHAAWALERITRPEPESPAPADP